jgi:hypothetical protein
MIYKYVTSPTEARNDIVSFYEDILMDELPYPMSDITTPQVYLSDVRAEAKDQVDDFGNDIEKHILKACDQPTTLKALMASYTEATTDPKTFIELRK